MKSKIFLFAKTYFVDDRLASFDSVKISLLGLLSLCCGVYCSGQSPTAVTPLPPSPQAASLGQFVDVPVGSYTGIPDISIPLIEIKNGDVSLPITASYHAGGIKVSQESSVLGLGWSLSAGGLISRTVKGKDDLSSAGFVYSQALLDDRTPGNWVLNSQAASTYFGWMEQSGGDTEPDFFFYNFAGYSGKLFIKKCLGCTLIEAIPERPNGLKFRYNNSTKIWQVVDGKGFVYSFQEKETTIQFTTVQGAPFLDDFDPIGSRLPGPNDEYISSWYLTSITSPRGYSISFAYKSYGYKSKTVAVKGHRVQKKLSVGGSLQDQHEYTMSAQVVNDVYLESIDFAMGRVELSTDDRTDVQSYTNRQYHPGVPVYLPQRVTALRLYHGASQVPQKTVLFDNDQYFGGVHTQTPHLYHRLKLDKISILDANSQQVLPYLFSYDASPIIPAKNSFSIDHWGYFNNAQNGSVGSSYFSSDSKTLIPTIIVNRPFGDPLVARGADRRSHETHSQLFVLKSVTYPTGAVSSYDYELNTFTNAPADYYIPGESTGPQRQSIRLLSSNVFMAQCPYDDAAYGSGVKTTEFQITSQTIARLYGEAVNECVQCDIDYMGQPFFYIGSPNNVVSMNLINASGTYLAKLERISGPGGSVTSLVKDLRFYYTTPPSTASDSYSSIHQNCSQNNFLMANENHHDFVLGSGWYKLTVYPINGMFTDVSFSYPLPAQNPVGEVKAGAGLRVKRIRVSDGGIERTRSYEYAGGELMTVPTYALPLSTDEINWIYTGTITPACYDVSILLAAESSIIPIGSSPQGNYVGYGLVTEYNGMSKEQSNGYTLQSFYNRSEDVVHSPVAPDVAGFYHLDNGLIHMILHVDAADQVVKRIDYSYELDQDSKQEVLGAKRFSVMGLPCPAVSYAYYTYKVEWWKRTGETTTIATGSGNQELAITYQYEPVSKMLRRTEATTSGSGKEVIYTSYPHDYANTSGFIHEMKENHLVAYPIEQVKYREVGSTRTILSGNITTYKTGGKGLVDQLLSLETTAPVALSAFKFSNRALGQLPPANDPANYAPDGRYKVRLTYNEYDTKGNPLQYTPADGVPVSYVWGYGGQYPVAEIRNATRATVVGALGGAAAVNNFGAQASPTETAVGNFLAPLRTSANLKQAQVSTYSYKPLVGMSSSTDASGRTTWYDYDGFGRLWRTRDHFGNVIEEYKYNYRQ